MKFIAVVSLVSAFALFGPAPTCDLTIQGIRTQLDDQKNNAAVELFKLTLPKQGIRPVVQFLPNAHSIDQLQFTATQGCGLCTIRFTNDNTIGPYEVWANGTPKFAWKPVQADDRVAREISVSCDPDAKRRGEKK